MALYEPTPRERLVFNSTDIFSSQPITALPCRIGIMPDDSFVETFATYLGMPSPAMRAFTLDPTRPYFICRSGREQKVDIYGDVVARAEVRGGDFRRSHDELKNLLNGMLKHAGFYTTLEARNMFQGNIDARYLDSYCTKHGSANAIIPDILIHNYKNVNGNSRTACLPAIIDVTLDREEMPLDGCYARDSCHKTPSKNVMLWKNQCQPGRQKLQTEKEERERTANDYEMRFSDIGKNYRFNHEYGDWYDDKKYDGKRRFY